MCGREGVGKRRRRRRSLKNAFENGRKKRGKRGGEMEEGGGEKQKLSHLPKVFGELNFIQCPIHSDIASLTPRACPE